MKKDIIPPVVSDIAVAIVHEEGEDGTMIWNSYLLNLKDETIEGVLVSTKGYGNKNKESVKTSMLRHFLDTMGPRSFSKIEPIVEDLLGLSNEFWVSFYLNKVMHDKKYVFMAESIAEKNLIKIPLIDKKGVMIK
jgi:hypothetical protein